MPHTPQDLDTLVSRDLFLLTTTRVPAMLRTLERRFMLT